MPLVSCLPHRLRCHQVPEILHSQWSLKIGWLKKLPEKKEGFPGGSDGKESTCSVEDLSSILGLGWFPKGGLGNPLQYSYLENSHGERSLAGCSPRGRKELDMTEWLSTHALTQKSGTVVKTLHAQCRDTGLIPGWRTKILGATQSNQKLKKKNKGLIKMSAPPVYFRIIISPLEVLTLITSAESPFLYKITYAQAPGIRMWAYLGPSFCWPYLGTRKRVPGWCETSLATASWSCGGATSRRDDKVCFLLSACFVSENLPPPPAAVQAVGRGAIAPDLHEAVIPGHMATGPEGSVRIQAVTASGVKAWVGTCFCVSWDDADFFV